MVGKKFFTGIILTLLTAWCYSGIAQTKAEAVEAYNNGANIYSTDVQGGITAFEKCISISNEVGADADSIKGLAIKILPELYFRKAAALFGEKKYEESVVAFQEAIKVAGKYNDTAVKEKSENNLPSLYYAIGATAYKDKDLPKATENLNNALKYDPNYAKAYYVLAVIDRSQKNYEKLEQDIDKAIETAKQTNDNSTEKSAVNLGKATFYNNFVNLTKAGKTTEAINSIKVAIKYAPDETDYYYYLGSAYNKVKNYDEAIANINKALDMDSSATAEAKARYYFEIATALAGKGDTSGACEAYKNAEYGIYVEQAKYQRTTVLKCQ